MKNARLARMGAVLALLLCLSLGAIAQAQLSPSYNLQWNIMASGGGPVSSASYTVNSTIGQAVAGPSHLSSASYRVSSGYWFGDTPGYHEVYLPIILRE